ncbi:hypothetical protein Patl1_18743 [Pistacia atlantica]|uniref:Uncharacterized protein n=1 Tax=Pistacia atlantica TaxID=434234 RepID=A0ACC1C2G5_9ROSI|nr:hypothetical protein Patl1_18743 [Pistacia atlantica]
MFSGSSSSRNWQTMDYDILVKIFTVLNLTDMVFGVSRVCKSWRFACRDPLLWATLNLNRLKANSTDILPSETCALLDNQSSWWRVMCILKNAFNLGCNNVTRLIFHYSMYINDEHLVYAAIRFPRVKHLVLPPCNQITVDGFHAAIQRWQELVSLIVPYICSPSKIMQMISANCKNFSILKVMLPFDLEFATTLFIYLPGLKVLSLRSVMVDKNALTIILKLMDGLEKLNLSHCRLIEVPRTPGPVTLFREMDNSIIAKASHLKEFCYCQELSCSICLFEHTDENFLKWYAYDEGLWREDEITSLAF